MAVVRSVYRVQAYLVTVMLAVLYAIVYSKVYKNSSGDEIANVNFYAVRPEATRIR